VISDEQIVVAIKEFNKQNVSLPVPGLDKSKPLQRLVRCWVDQLPAEVMERYSNETYQQVVDMGARVDYGDVQRIWFDFFGVPVIGSIGSIRLAGASLQHPDKREQFSASSLKGLRDSELEPFGFDAVNSFHALREAAALLGFPCDYYIRREANKSGFRPPVIEVLEGQHIESESLHSKLESLVSIARIWDGYDYSLKYTAKAGKQSFETWAIRRLWGAISEIFEATGSEFNVKNPWVTIRDMLKLSNVDVDAETVRKTIKAISKIPPA